MLEVTNVEIVYRVLGHGVDGDRQPGETWAEITVQEITSIQAVEVRTPGWKLWPGNRPLLVEKKEMNAGETFTETVEIERDMTRRRSVSPGTFWKTPMGVKLLQE